MQSFLLKSIFITTLLFLVLSAKVQAQDLNYVQGDVLVQLSPNGDAATLAARFKHWEGTPTRIYVKRQVSQNLNIWLYHFNYKKIDEHRFLTALKASRLVIEAQWNHLVKKRATPNDPLFSNQWQYINDGSSGGVVDADIDADEAWDITTGGLTALGDTIVVCVIDDGIDDKHEDIVENLWYNYGEIPDNGIDDDGNGFVDDYKGWNTFAGNDDITDAGVGGGHGTPVAGIVGAKGDNGIGVTGVNWDVKLMIVVGGSGDEAEVLMSYDYPLSLRKMYNASGGTEGAFVVSTNASWGIDNGQPADAPLWCAMYDSLGMHGIISCGATANRATNVDLDGDLPTACDSDYLIAVTNMDRTDTKVTAAGFGLTSIDLGAFGESTFAPDVNDNYGPFGGTSGATPHVTGAVALLYAHPCPGFISIAKGDPEAGAALAKRYILEGVDPNPSLDGITVTGGRLNLKNALDLLGSECDGDGCYVPFSLAATGITLNETTINWQSGTLSDTFNIRYRTLGEVTWIDIMELDTNRLELSSLMACTEYEFQVQAICLGTTTAFSESRLFRTEGCCEPPLAITASSSVEDQINVNWDTVMIATGYELSYKEISASTWTEQYSTNTKDTLMSLMACTTYELRLRTICNTVDTSAYSAIYMVRTSGCGICIDGAYCEGGAGSDDFEWISKVVLNTIDNTSGQSGGYTDFTNISTMLTRGESYPIIIEQMYSGAAFGDQFEVWIDFNQDGDFEDAQEKVFQTEEASATAVNGMLTIPPSAMLGATRMRVMMKFNTLSNDPCSTYNFGEIEDYCVDIQDTDACLVPVFIEGIVDGNKINLTWEALDQVDEFLVEYINADLTDWLSISTNNSFLSLEGLTDCTPYKLRITSFCAGVEGAMSEVLNLKTSNCGRCIDLPYCGSLGEDAGFEWMESVKVNTLENVSGNNNGYQYFEGLSTSMEQGKDYEVTLVPGFDDGTFEEFFRIWIDFDQDGVFSGTELVYNSGSTTGAVNGMISIPSTALDGETRMRVSMKFNEIPDACESFSFGEVEDYCINIGEPDVEACELPSNITEANITSSSVVISWSANSSAIGFELRYRLEGTSTWMGDAISTTDYTIEALMACSTYEYELKTVCDIGVSDFTDTKTFTTDCSTGIFDIDAPSFSLNAFPNPFSERTTIAFESNWTGTGQLEYFDIHGKRLANSHKVQINRGLNSIEVRELQNLPTGVYFARISSGKETGIVRLLKIE